MGRKTDLALYTLGKRATFHNYYSEYGELEDTTAFGLEAWEDLCDTMRQFDYYDN